MNTSYAVTACAVNYFFGQNGGVGVPLARIVLQVIGLTLVRVGLGMLLRVKDVIVMITSGA